MRSESVFPVAGVPLFNSNDTTNTNYCDGSPGLTKRELFAAMCMQGLLSNTHYSTDVAKRNLTSDIELKIYGVMSVGFADSLLNELAKAGGPGEGA
jgi:ubiquitin C-terminal hydrolase